MAGGSLASAVRRAGAARPLGQTSVTLCGLCPPAQSWAPVGQRNHGQATVRHGAAGPAGGCLTKQSPQYPTEVRGMPPGRQEGHAPPATQPERSRQPPGDASRATRLQWDANTSPPAPLHSPPHNARGGNRHQTPPFPPCAGGPRPAPSTTTPLCPEAFGAVDLWGRGLRSPNGGCPRARAPSVKPKEAPQAAGRAHGFRFSGRRGTSATIPTAFHCIAPPPPPPPRTPRGAGVPWSAHRRCMRPPPPPSGAHRTCAGGTAGVGGLRGGGPGGISSGTHGRGARGVRSVSCTGPVGHPPGAPCLPMTIWPGGCTAAGGPRCIHRSLDLAGPPDY